MENTHGTVFRISGQHIAKVLDLTLSGRSRDGHDITTHDVEDETRDYDPSLKSSGDVSLELLFDTEDEGHMYLDAAFEGGEMETCEILNASAFWRFRALVTSIGGFEFNVDGIPVCSVGLKVQFPISSDTATPGYAIPGLFLPGYVPAEEYGAEE